MRTPTPETDAKACRHTCEDGFHAVEPCSPDKGSWVDIDFARKLERERDEAKQCFEIAKGNTEAALNSFHAEQKQRRKAEQELEVSRKRVSEYQPYADNALTISAKVIEWTECERERDQLREVADNWKSTSEMLMTVVCNASDSNWKKETPDWQTAARRYVDEYYIRLKQYNQLPHVIERNKTK